VIVLLGICVGTFYLFKTKPSGFVPTEDGGRLFITYQLADASSTIESVTTMEKIMKVVSATPGILHYTAVSGFNILNGGATSNAGSMFIMLTPWDDRTTPETQWPGIRAVLLKRIAAAGVKNASVNVAQPPTIRGVGVSAGYAFQIEQGSSTDDIYAFEKVVQKFVAEAKKVPPYRLPFPIFRRIHPATT
jgi:HAE1 family hydrophobic/amphiphilic exporter-1